MSWDPVVDMPMFLGTIIISFFISWLAVGRNRRLSSWLDHWRERTFFVLNCTLLQWTVLSRALTGQPGVWEGQAGNAFVLFSMLLWPLALITNFLLWIHRRKTWREKQSRLRCWGLLLSWSLPILLLVAQMMIMEHLRSSSFSLGYLHALPWLAACLTQGGRDEKSEA